MAEQNVQGADEDNVQILELMGEGSVSVQTYDINRPVMLVRSAGGWAILRGDCWHGYLTQASS